MVTNLFAAPSIQSQFNYISKIQSLSAIERNKIHKPNQLLVRYRGNVVNNQTQSIASLNGALPSKSLGAMGSSTINATRWQLLKFPTNRNLDQIRAALLRDNNVETVEYDYIAHGSAVSNDPGLSSMWGLNNSSSSNSTVGVDIDAYRAWGLQTGSASVVVAINPLF